MTAGSRSVTHDALVGAIAARAKDLGRRCIVALAGPPGAGKTTLATALERDLSGVDGLVPSILPMDGYHLDDAVLEARGRRAFKGAPDTFDAAGFRHMLLRLKQNTEAEIAVPVFDRDLEISRAGARIVPKDVNVLIVEGNYLLLDQPIWRDLAPHFDLTVAVCVSQDELRRRLTERWTRHNIPEAEIVAKVEANDLPNGMTVLTQSIRADYEIAAG